MELISQGIFLPTGRPLGADEGCDEWVKTHCMNGSVRRMRMIVCLAKADVRTVGLPAVLPAAVLKPIPIESMMKTGNW